MLDTNMISGLNALFGFSGFRPDQAEQEHGFLPFAAKLTQRRHPLTPETR